MAADDYEDEAPPAPNTMVPALDEFRKAPTTPIAADMADQVTTKIDDYVKQRQIVDANIRAGEILEANIHEIGQNYVEMARRDPSSANLAVSLLRPSIGAIVASVPGHPEDQLEQHHEEITRPIEAAIARSAVQSMAERDENGARALLGSVKQHLPEGEHAALDSYIDVQARARDMDAAGRAQMVAQQRQYTEDLKSWTYLSNLLNTGTGQPRFTPGWAQQVLKDPDVGPAASAGLVDIYGRLLVGGDAPSTDPETASQLVSQAAQGAASVSDILSHAGTHLRLQDALSLATLTRPENRNEARAVDATLHAAKRILAPPENGLAGQMAYERFVNYLLPAYRETGVGSLNPKAENYLLADKEMGGAQGAAGFWNHFAPRMDDVALGAVIPGSPTGPNVMDTWLHRQERDRPSLEDIFGKRAPPAGDRVIRQPRQRFLQRGPTHNGVDMGRTPDNPVFEDNGEPGYPGNKPKAS